MGLVRKLKKLISIPQVYDRTGNNYPEMKMVSYLKQRNNKLQQDAKGNLYLINEGTPLVCAHMDTRQTYLSTQACTIKGSLKITDGVLQAYNAQGKTQCMGADDKCGVAIAMQLYEELGDSISLLFTVQEETGLQGARYFYENHRDLLSKCLYCIVPDRMNAGDIVGTANSYCSLEFQNQIYDEIKDFGFKPANGVSSDANILRNELNCVNLSVGYKFHHTDNEQVTIDEFYNSFAAIYNILITIEDKLPIYKEPEKAKDWDTYNNRYNKGKKQDALPFKDTEDDDDYRSRKYPEMEEARVSIDEKLGTITFNADTELMPFNNMNEENVIMKGTYRFFKYKETDENKKPDGSFYNYGY